MSNYVVEVENLKIRFNLASEKVDNLKEDTIKLVKHELMFQEFLALQDVNLKIKKGESWGLVGANGSGKSTLLKTISGILKPLTLWRKLALPTVMTTVPSVLSVSPPELKLSSSSSATTKLEFSANNL